MFNLGKQCTWWSSTNIDALSYCSIGRIFEKSASANSIFTGQEEGITNRAVNMYPLYKLRPSERIGLSVIG